MLGPSYARYSCLVPKSTKTLHIFTSSKEALKCVSRELPVAVFHGHPAIDTVTIKTDVQSIGRHSQQHQDGLEVGALQNLHLQWPHNFPLYPAWLLYCCFFRFQNHFFSHSSPVGCWCRSIRLKVAHIKFV